ncbi:GDP-L-fucose synthase family protein [Chloroflexota bacterium]
MEKNDRIYVSGHEGMIGSAVVRRLKAEGFTQVLTKSSNILEVTDQKAVADYFTSEIPEYVFLATTELGGIQANINHPAEFIFVNLQAQNNIIHTAWKTGVKKLLFWASSCIYPRECPQPMKEDYILTGAIEPTSEAYAIAKIAGIRMCQAYNRQHGTNFISTVPSDTYGPGDDFNPETSHFLPGLMRRIHEAKTNGDERVVVWGTGLPRREAFFADDLASASIFLMENYNESGVINIGSGTDHSIKDLASTLCDIIGFRGELVFDTSRPDGAPRKLLDTGKLEALGWSPHTSREEGIARTYSWFKDHITG